MPSAGREVIVVGGGISGLSAAYDLTRGGATCTVLEKKSRMGGVIETRTIENCVIEGGPDSFLSAKPEALALIQELGLAGKVIGSNDQERVTYILKKGRLVELPEGVMMIVPSRVMPMVKSRLLSWPAKMRMGLEVFQKPGSSRDRSVAEFVIDHFGQEALDYLAEPLLSGVYGGDPAQMSVACVLPRFLKMEAEHGSLVRGVLQARGKHPSGGTLFRTLQDGLGELIDALASNMNIQHAEAETIERDSAGTGLRVRAGGDWIEADQVVLACPAWASARLLAGLDADLARLLEQIPYTSSLTLSLIYRTSGFDGRRAGFGFLVPIKERQRLVACTFVNAKFPGRAPENRVVLRCFFGGASDPGALEEADDALLSTAREELRRILGLAAAPIAHSISRWPRSMAQYTLGHVQRLQQIQSRASCIAGLHFAGNWLDGIGISDCIRSGRLAARRALTGIAPTSSS